VLTEIVRRVVQASRRKKSYCLEAERGEIIVQTAI